MPPSSSSTRSTPCGVTTEVVPVLGGLVEDGHVRWFDERDLGERAFTASPLPRTPDAYIRYLDNVLDFVQSRNEAIAAAAGSIG